MKRKLTFYSGLIILLVINSCKPDTPEKSETTISIHQKLIGVSVWDRISTRSEPIRKSPSTTLLSLGESFIYLDSFAIDSSYNNTKFLKARLSDSSIVWVRKFKNQMQHN